jgi:hypothetical protein
MGWIILFGFISQWKCAPTRRKIYNIGETKFWLQEENQYFIDHCLNMNVCMFEKETICFCKYVEEAPSSSTVDFQVY